MSEFDELEFARAFHGHLGPFLALGIGIGACAMKALNARKYFGVHVTVHCPPKPPESCMVDGLQLSTGATYGKRNIEVIPSDEIAIQFTNTDTNERLRAVMKPGTVERLRKWLEELGDEGAAKMVLSCAEEMFEFVKE